MYRNAYGSCVAFSYIARSEDLPPGAIASYSESRTSNGLDDRRFRIIKEVAFSRIVVLLNVGFWLQMILLII